MKTAAKVVDKIKRIPSWAGRTLDSHPVLFTAGLALAVVWLVESICRLSPIDGLVFLFTHPLNMLANYFIVLSTLSLSHLFRKRGYVMMLFCLLWIVLGIVDGAVAASRGIPFSLADILLLPSVWTILPVYLDIWLIVLLGVLLVLFIAGLVFLGIKAPKHKVRLRMAAVLIAGSVLLAVGAYSVTVVGHEKRREETFGNISEAYDTYGFVYCFCTGAVDMGVSRPEFYSRAAVNWLLGNMEDETEARIRPNIIMVQLESFFDISRLDDLSCEKNPVPVFTSLRDRYTSGLLTVPSIGGGTANTEFEVLSGMSLDFFGMGEYPYQTILKEEACESVAWDLKKLGYTCTAIHNNTGTFYGRNEVMAQLGFDSFVSVEYMQNVEYNPIGWAKDNVLTREILKALDSTRDRDFIFTITVQGHGKYQLGIDSVDTEDLGITWATDPDDEDALAYYASQLSETDAFIGDLIDALSRRAEPTVVVLYGDHLPNFDIGSEQLKNGDNFQTEYVIWSNFNLSGEEENLAAYQLSAKVLGDIGIDSGLLTRYHQQMRDTDDYLDGLKLLEYDMLYGDYYCYGGASPYVATDLKLGLDTVTVTGYEIDEENGVLRVSGQNFTGYSCVYLDDRELETRMDEEGRLVVPLEELGKLEKLPGKVLTVRQNTKNGVTLSESVGIIIE